MQGSNSRSQVIYWPYNSVYLFSISSGFTLFPVLMIKWISITKCSITGIPVFTLIQIMTVAHHKLKSKKSFLRANTFFATKLPIFPILFPSKSNFSLFSQLSELKLFCSSSLSKYTYANFQMKHIRRFVIVQYVDKVGRNTVKMPKYC